ncbi:MAG: hypothetical protein ACFFBD_11065 [Candidatus Hodarchaeota archaeon]
MDFPALLVIAYITFALSSSQESGAFATWFDNNYKVAVGDIDPHREIYRLFQGKSQMIFDVTGGIMLIVGGGIATLFQRELVFAIQSCGLFFLAFLLPFVATNFPEIEKAERSLKEYFKLLSDGVTSVISSPALLFLVGGAVFYNTAIIIFFNLTLFPIYFGYTGTDLGASIFRFALFFGGALAIWKVSDWIKNIQVKKWIPLLTLIHNLLFFGGMALLMFLFPIENRLNLTAALLVGMTILVGHVMRMSISFLTQRIYLDTIDDKKRNGFYSLLPTVILMVTSPLTAISGNIGETQGFSNLFVFLGILALIGTFFYFIAMRFVVLPEKTNNNETLIK